MDAFFKIRVPLQVLHLGSLFVFLSRNRTCASALIVTSGVTGGGDIDGVVMGFWQSVMETGSTLDRSCHILWLGQVTD